jgi:hypothetical protein
MAWCPPLAQFAPTPGRIHCATFMVIAKDGLMYLFRGYGQRRTMYITPVVSRTRSDWAVYWTSLTHLNDG